jgi:hypothetical protein
VDIIEMPKVSVQKALNEYLALADKKGLFYEMAFRDAQKEKELKKKAHTVLEAFLDECDYLSESVRVPDMGEMIRASLQDVICAMKRKSGEEYLVCNDFFAFLGDRYKVTVSPFDRQLTPLERQLSIAKDMHDFNKARTFDRNEVARRYLVSDRTIDSDLAALHDGISVMDQKLALKDFCLKSKKVTAVSTMHPLFLTQNLTQIVCMLEGLRRMEDNWALRSYARSSAVSIWRQLSGYARDRILGTLTDLMGLEHSWYEEISEAAEKEAERMFYNEDESSDSNGRLMYALKGSLPCSIVFIDDDDMAMEICGKVVHIKESGIEMLAEGAAEPVVISREKILEVEVATEFR